MAAGLDVLPSPQQHSLLPRFLTVASLATPSQRQMSQPASANRNDVVATRFESVLVVALVVAPRNRVSHHQFVHSANWLSRPPVGLASSPARPGPAVGPIRSRPPVAMSRLVAVAADTGFGPTRSEGPKESRVRAPRHVSPGRADDALARHDPVPGAPDWLVQLFYAAWPQWQDGLAKTPSSGAIRAWVSDGPAPSGTCEAVEADDKTRPAGLEGAQGGGWRAVCGPIIVPRQRWFARPRVSVLRRRARRIRNTPSHRRRRTIFASLRLDGGLASPPPPPLPEVVVSPLSLSSSASSSSSFSSSRIEGSTEEELTVHETNTLVELFRIQPLHLGWCHSSPKDRTFRRLFSHSVVLCTTA
ncbi:unnamed protein product [Protopolystoma xenopodis]|uniref:Uncharacterized protein n=1 Tax=Protopolystoma xenopodis TaxID=117903 RepID=A0A448XLF0_9PLAT|nr:unnamed protein product [Protopolystoma xenopodis]